MRPDRERTTEIAIQRASIPVDTSPRCRARLAQHRNHNGDSSRVGDRLGLSAGRAVLAFSTTLGQILNGDAFTGTTGDEP